MPPLSPTEPDPTDEELASRTLSGDSDAFEILVERYADRIYRFARRFTGDDEDAQDLVQETFLRLHRHLPSLRLDAPLKPWLYHVCTNLCRNLAAKRTPLLFSDLEQTDGEEDTRDFVQSVPAEEDLPDAVLQRKDLVAEVRTAVAALPPKYRIVVELCYYENLSYQDIADALSLPLNTVRTHLSRAKALLVSSLASSSLP